MSMKVIKKINFFYITFLFKDTNYVGK